MVLRRSLFFLGSFLALSFVTGPGVQAGKPPPPTDPPSGGGSLTAQQQLGELLFMDPNLSEPAGQSCKSCHDPAAGFADPDTQFPVSEGVVRGRFGTRNSPSAGYTGFSPEFTNKRGIQGGQFWDGRSPDLADQARGPFLNPVEMNNTTKGQVVGKVQLSPYALRFTQLCGANAFQPANVEKSYVCLSEAIAAYERSGVFSPFSSKFDAVQAGRASFTAQEKRGWDLFTGNAKCAHCHLAKVGAGSPILFTDFKYHNIGLPENRDVFALAGAATIDLGLGGVLNDPQQYGRFKNPHLRNIAVTPPYMHNGVLKTLKDVVHFYNTRDVWPACDPGLGNRDPEFGKTCWARPEIPETMDSSFVGNLNLTEAEEDAIVAFMLTLTDGYFSP